MRRPNNRVVKRELRKLCRQYPIMPSLKFNVKMNERVGRLLSSTSNKSAKSSDRCSRTSPLVIVVVHHLTTAEAPMTPEVIIVAEVETKDVLILMTIAPIEGDDQISLIDTQVILNQWVRTLSRLDNLSAVRNQRLRTMTAKTYLRPPYGWCPFRTPHTPCDVLLLTKPQTSNNIWPAQQRNGLRTISVWIEDRLKNCWTLHYSCEEIVHAFYDRFLGRGAAAQFIDLYNNFSAQPSENWLSLCQRYRTIA